MSNGQRSKVNMTLSQLSTRACNLEAAGMTFAVG